MTKQEIAQDFLRLASKGESREAFLLYTGENFRHHNPFFKGDKDSLIAAMEESASENPDKIIDVQRILADGDFVAVHSHIRQNQNDKGAAVVHIFRFDQGRIVELWDVGQAVPDHVVNEYGIF